MAPHPTYTVALIWEIGIRNEFNNEKALAVVEELMHRRDRTPEEDELYELLIALIEKFKQ